MEYVFKMRKGLFWRTHKAVGHALNIEADRMDIYLKDGGITSIGSWSKYELKLSTDWVRAVQKRMEEESGQDIKLKSNLG